MGESEEQHKKTDQQGECILGGGFGGEGDGAGGVGVGLDR